MKVLNRKLVGWNRYLSCLHRFDLKGKWCLCKLNRIYRFDYTRGLGLSNYSWREDIVQVCLNKSWRGFKLLWNWGRYFLEFMWQSWFGFKYMNVLRFLIFIWSNFLLGQRGVDTDWDSKTTIVRFDLHFGFHYWCSNLWLL